jgi:hypothetical protein
MLMELFCVGAPEPRTTKPWSESLSILSSHSVLPLGSDFPASISFGILYCCQVSRCRRNFSAWTLRMVSLVAQHNVHSAVALVMCINRYTTDEEASAERHDVERNVASFQEHEIC